MADEVNIVPVGTEDIETLCGLAKEIWTEHYASILSDEQVAYMVERFQSVPAVTDQLDKGYRYYFLRSAGESLAAGENGGFMGICPEEDGLFLSKLYVHREFRRRGLARAALSYLRELCRREGYPKIRLTVNKRNAGSIAAYRRMGFQTVKEQTVDIGHGFVMDDYVMELEMSFRN